MATVAERLPDEWRLPGERTSVTGLVLAHKAIVFARSESGPSAFPVDLDDSRVSRQRFRDPGQRPVGRGAVTFDSTFVSQERLLGEGAEARGSRSRSPST